MAPDSGEPDAAALRDRVAQLEQTVSEQQATIESLSSPTASRRGFVKSAAAVAGLGALGIYSSYPASAQAAGQVGTQSEPVDVEAWSLSVQDQLAGDLDAGGNSLTNVGAAEVTGAVTAGSVNVGEDDSGVSNIKSVGRDCDVKILNREPLADGESITLQSFIGSRAAIVMIYQQDPNVAAPFAVSSDNVSILSPHPNFSASDTDGDTCLFISSGSLILKNRTGSSHQYGAYAMILGA